MGAALSVIVRWSSGVILFVLGLSLAPAQTGSSDKPFDMEELEPVPDSEADRAKPQFRFEPIAEVSLPGPLPGSEPFVDEAGIVIEVAGGFAVVSWDGVLELHSADDPLPVDPLNDVEFAFSEDGMIRCSTMPTGWIKAEKFCASCRKSWRKKWKVRAPGSDFARPLVTDKRVYYGTTDNRVYSVKRKNGHRVWATDIGGRVIRPLELLRVTAPPDLKYIGRRGTRLMDVVLVVPDSGESMVALEGRGGTRVAAYQLPENEALVGPPLTRGANVAVVRQRYDASDAAMLLFELRPPLDPGAAPPVLAIDETDPSVTVKEGNLAEGRDSE
jgi:hypothetical protein